MAAALVGSRCIRRAAFGVPCVTLHEWELGQQALQIRALSSDDASSSGHPATSHGGASMMAIRAPPRGSLGNSPEFREMALQRLNMQFDRGLEGVELPRFVQQELREARQAAMAPFRTPRPVEEAVEACRKDAMQRIAGKKLGGSLEVHLRLGVDPRRGDEVVRGAAVLPHGSGKEVSVCAFVSTALVDAVRAAGASVIGDIDLVQRIVSEGPKAITFDKVVATPDQMPVLSRAARVLGPRGLMPNPKVGTVTEDPASVVSELRGGRIEFRVDKHAMLHAGVGKAEWAADQLLKNVGAFVAAVAAAKPTKLKCAPLSPLYIKQCYIASTFGPGYHVQLPSLYETARLARD